MKIKLLNRKGEEVCSGKYLYLERGCNKDNDRNFFIVFYNKDKGDLKIHLDGDLEIHFDCNKEEMAHFLKRLNDEFKDDKE